MIVAILTCEIGAFEAVVDSIFVFFSYVEYKWSNASVVVVAFLFPDGCASDGDDYACGRFSYFDG